MFNLLSVLPERDKELITRYVTKYGVYDGFIGVDRWLEDWGKNKIKLYKMFGNQFSYTIPFSYEKGREELSRQMSELLYPFTRGEDNKSFRRIFFDFLDGYILYDKELIPDAIGKKEDNQPFFKKSDTQNKIEDFCIRAMDHYCWTENSITCSIKIKLPVLKKELQIQEGAKPVKAINKFLTYFAPYFKDNKDYQFLMKEFEKFRLAHSVILNDKLIKGDLVLSIHPLDFITMSDNDSNWESCMNWVGEGCYHVGTIEMMNSNNVIVCYITNKKDWTFDKDSETGEAYLWNNKKWRQLAYVTPEIIMTGKAYPYNNKQLSFTILEALDKLAKENLGITYEYGIERYEDMKYINTIASMDRARYYRNLPEHRYHKKNIIFDTKGMYNDMLNDSSTKYWCVRNKVKHNKIISYSGKAPCLCCGGPIIYETLDDYDYNERYANCGSAVCTDCLENFRCDVCSETYSNKKHYKIFLENGTEIQICEDCVRDYIRKCPDCGRTMFVESMYGAYNICVDEKIDHLTTFIKLKEETDPYEFGNITYSTKERLDNNFETIYPICRCGRCSEKDDRFEVRNEKIGYGWSDRTADFLVSKEVQKKEDWEKYFSYNLEKIEVCDGEMITN